MNEKIKIQKYEIKDFERVTELLQEISKFKPNIEEIEEISYEFLNQKNICAYVAITDSKVIAFGSIHIYMRVRGGKTAVIEDMIVAPLMRGKGIGRKLLDVLIEESRTRGCFKISLEASSHAESFYQYAGFKISGRNMKMIF